jgi:threonine dehydrogenase-like Zn-dependent dehydrogenase
VGYSFVGIVRERGAGVAAWEVGQRVVGQARHGSWVVVDADRPLVPVPDDVAPDLAAFVVLLTVALNGVRLAHIQIGEPVAVLGQGLVGQLAGQLARVNGARPVVALDALALRLAVARAGGATHTLDVSTVEQTRLPEAVRTATGGDGPRVVIEATGIPQPVNTALKIAAHGARVILLGSTRGLVEQWDPYLDVHRKAVIIVGAHSPSSHPATATFQKPFTVPANMRVSLDLIRDGSLRLEPLITDRFPGHEAGQAYAALLADPARHLGVILDWRR